MIYNAPRVASARQRRCTRKWEAESHPSNAGSMTLIFKPCARKMGATFETLRAMGRGMTLEQVTENVIL
jgi:hypothetical protein